MFVPPCMAPLCVCTLFMSPQGGFLELYTWDYGRGLKEDLKVKYCLYLWLYFPYMTHSSIFPSPVTHLQLIADVYSPLSADGREPSPVLLGSPLSVFVTIETERQPPMPPSEEEQNGALWLIVIVTLSLEKIEPAKNGSCDPSVLEVVRIDKYGFHFFFTLP